MTVILVLFFNLSPLFLLENDGGPNPEVDKLGCERRRGRQEAPKRFHEQPLCAISKPRKLSPLAVVWTSAWWELVLSSGLFVCCDGP